LASKHASTASAPATLVNASIRALSATVSPFSVASARSVRGHWIAAFSDQKRATSVCSGVRTALSARPYALTSLKSSAYSALVSGFGPSGRNWSFDVSVSGLTCFSLTSTGVVPAGKGSKTPGPGVGWTHWMTLSKPSPARQARMSAATSWPMAIPLSFAGPSGIAARYLAALGEGSALVVGPRG
jgi:hypothetical protein